MNKLFLAADIVLILLITSCGTKEPLSIPVSPGVFVKLPGAWRFEGSEKTGSTEVFRFTRDTESTVRAAVSPARDIPFSKQIIQDRNSLNTRKDYEIKMENNTEVMGLPAYMFLATTVEKGIRLKVKIVLFQKDRTLIYLTIKSPEDSFEKTVRDFNAMIEDLSPGSEKPAS